MPQDPLINDFLHTDLVLYKWERLKKKATVENLVNVYRDSIHIR